MAATPLCDAQSTIARCALLAKTAEADGIANSGATASIQSKPGLSQRLTIKSTNEPPISGPIRPKPIAMGPKISETAAGLMLNWREIRTIFQELEPYMPRKN